MNSLRAKGVMSLQAASAVEFAISASRRSTGSLCTTPPGTGLLLIRMLMRDPERIDRHASEVMTLSAYQPLPPVSSVNVRRKAAHPLCLAINPSR